MHTKSTECFIIVCLKEQHECQKMHGMHDIQALEISYRAEELQYDIVCGSCGTTMDGMNTRWTCKECCTACPQWYSMQSVSPASEFVASSDEQKCLFEERRIEQNQRYHAHGHSKHPHPPLQQVELCERQFQIRKIPANHHGSTCGQRRLMARHPHSWRWSVIVVAFAGAVAGDFDVRCGGMVNAVRRCANVTHAALASCVDGRLGQ